MVHYNPFNLFVETQHAASLRLSLVLNTREIENLRRCSSEYSRVPGIYHAERSEASRSLNWGDLIAGNEILRRSAPQNDIGQEPVMLSPFDFVLQGSR